jgi:site-specific DNA-methyltransferase (cytosine-N4-specific)
MKLCRSLTSRNRKRKKPAPKPTPKYRAKKLPARLGYGVTHTIHHGDCLDVLPKLAANSIDAVISDPPYPEIRRSYGTLTESQWHKLMDGVVKETRRVLKPHGSAVFILQPNFNKLGNMRLWLWEFLLRTAKDWNLVQNVYWWNYSSPTLAGCKREHGLCRNSVKYCLWFGPPDCYRAQGTVLWEPAKFSPSKLEQRALKYGPSGQSRRDGRSYTTAQERGGSVPFNLIPCSASEGGGQNSASYGHGAGTPQPIADWWTKYVTKPGDTILDPFNGCGTMGVSAVSQGRKYVGIEKNEEWCQISQQRICSVPALAV